MQGWISTGSISGGVDAVVSDIEKFGQAVTQGPITSVTNAWIKVFAIAAVGGLAIWLLETKVAKHEGLAPPGTPPVPQLGAAPPTFAAQGGYTARAGPITFGSGVGAGSGGATSAPIYEVSSGGYSSAAARGGPGRREQRATTRAHIAEANARTAEAQRRTQKAQTGGGYTRRRSA